jgi:hypothetical protein
MGVQLGWPEARLKALQKETQSTTDILRYPWAQVSPADPADPAESRREFPCDGVLRYDDFIDQFAAHGGNERAAIKVMREREPG